MFLSKLFSIFRKKKDDKNQSDDTKPAVTPPGTIGAAVGVSQPGQGTTPDSGKIAQAADGPDFPKPDIEAVSDSVNPDQTPPADSEAFASVNNDAGEPPQPTVEEPPITPETPPTPPQETPVEPPASDDSQNIAV